MYPIVSSILKLSNHGSWSWKVDAKNVLSLTVGKCTETSATKTKCPFSRCTAAQTTNRCRRQDSRSVGSPFTGAQT